MTCIGAGNSVGKSMRLISAKSGVQVLLLTSNCLSDSRFAGIVKKIESGLLTLHPTTIRIQKSLISVVNNTTEIKEKVLQKMDLVKFLTVSMVLFLLGIWGIFLNRKNILIMLMSIELMILAVNLNFLFFSAYLDDLIGQLFALLVLTVAAAESAIGLALLVVYYRVRGTISVEFINLIKG